MNRVLLTGRTVRDGELKQTTNGLSLVQFQIAVPKLISKDADFIDCIAWRNTAEYFCKYIKKGSLIAVSGRLETRTYQAQDGTNKKVVEVICDSVECLRFAETTEENAESDMLDLGV